MNTGKKIKFAAAVILLFSILTAAGCSGGKVIARVNGEKIFKDELDSKVAEMKAGFESQGVSLEGEQGEQMRARLEEEAVDQLINETLLFQEAEKRDIELNDDEVEQQLEQLKDRYGDENFEQLLKEQNLTKKYLKDQIRLQLAADRLYKTVTEDMSVSKEETKSFFEDNREDFVKRKAAHILISTPQEASEKEQQEARKKANTIIQQLNEGVEFSSLAEEYSDDPSTAGDGGVMDRYFTKNDPYLMPEFTEAAFELEKGEFSSQPVETSAGYHIIKIMDKEESFVELKDEVENRILSDKRNEEFTRYFEEIKKNADIEDMRQK